MTEKTSITLAADETVLFVHPYMPEEIDEMGGWDDKPALN